MTPLHAAISACGPARESQSPPNTFAEDSLSQTKTTQAEHGATEEEGGEEEVDIEKTKATVKELFLSGAIWNDLDTNNETPGCLAWRLGQKELYELCVEAGVRAEMLLGIMGGYEELESDDDEEEEEGKADQADGEGENGHTSPPAESTNGIAAQAEEEEISISNRDVNSADYLKSELKFSDDKLLDADANGVMMAWETSIMSRTVDLLLPSPPSSPTGARPSPATGKRILNIGFGMGIIDRLFASTVPLTHHIIEAHPAILSRLSEPDSDFGSQWSASSPPGGSYIIHAGRWQDIVPKLIQSGAIFDAIYFDTFGEPYSALKFFFSEYVPALLDAGGRFGFFNGMGADRRVCYDVYCRVVEMDLCAAGLDVAWTDVEVRELGEEGKGEWRGVRRRYWTLDEYRLPVCTFLE